MKIRIPVLALLVNLSLAAAALAAPELTVEQGTFDFGTVPQGRKVQHNFGIRNSGDAPLQIKQLSADCGCTAAKPSTSLILPGQSAEVQVTFDSADFSGKVQKSVFMATNAGKTPGYTFTMSGNVFEELQVVPRQLSLGQVPAETGSKASITLNNRGNSKIKLLSVKLDSPSLKVKAKIRNGVLKPGASGTIELTFKPRKEAKLLSGYLHILTNHPQNKDITIPIYGSLAK